MSVAFQRANFQIEGVGPSRLPPSSFGYSNASHTHVTNGRIAMGVDTVEITGPFEATAPKTTASRERIFVCTPANVQEESACARSIASTLARRAYRRPVTDSEVDNLLQFYERADGFNVGIRRIIEKVLVAPDFLFKVETAPIEVKAGAPYHISDLELASRLSFFLWSSIPDEELLGVAAAGQLSDYAELCLLYTSPSPRDRG